MGLRVIGHKLRPSTRARIALPAKKAKAFYLSPEWRALMVVLIKQRGRRCQDPQHDPSKPRDGVRIFGDHVVEIDDGGALLEPSNIMLRCGACHTRKTAAVRARRVGGV
jgi:hypothetical protein